MVLSDHDIKIEIEKGRIVLDPFCAELIQPASIDVRLGNDFRVFRNSDHVAIDPELHQPDLTEQIIVSDGDAFVLHPGQFVLGTTLERILKEHVPGVTRVEAVNNGPAADMYDEYAPF